MIKCLKNIVEGSENLRREDTKSRLETLNNELNKVCFDNPAF
jgi:hypothetical protein